MARNFNGATDVIKKLSASVVPSITTGTIGFWFKPGWNSGDSVNHVLYESLCTTSGFIQAPIFQKFSDNNIYCGFNTEGGTDQRIVLADTGLFVSGTWAYWTFTYSIAAGQTLYKNAVSKGTHSFASVAAAATDVVIGNSDTADGSSLVNLNGSLADVAFWNGVILSAGEITALTNGARPYNIRRASLSGWWPLDGLQSPEPDLSGNKNNGTVTGTTLATGPPMRLFTPRRLSVLPTSITAASFDMSSMGAFVCA